MKENNYDLSNSKDVIALLSSYLDFNETVLSVHSIERCKDLTIAVLAEDCTEYKIKSNNEFDAEALRKLGLDLDSIAKDDRYPGFALALPNMISDDKIYISINFLKFKKGD